MEIRVLAGLQSANLDQAQNNGLDLASIYDKLVDRWLAPLGQTIPARVRLAKEQLSRRVAADLVLASHVLGQKHFVTDEQETQMSATSQSQDHQGPWPGEQPSSSLPTPSPSLTSSLISGSISSHPSTLLAPSEISRLSRYTTFAEQPGLPSALPKSLSSVLAHWQVGTDPATYDWLATMQRLETEYDEQGLTERERARLKRRAERHLERQRRETAVALSQGFMSTQAPQLVSASQPVLLPDRGAGGASQPLVLLSSSQTQSQSPAFPASQIEPGRFGGRAPAKKKRRTLGF